MLQRQSPVQTCARRWMIQLAIGPTSLGMCRFCREVREFKNSIDTGVTMDNPGRIRLLFHHPPQQVS